MSDSFTCPRCGRRSHNPRDVEARYCGHCHAYLEQLLAFRLYVDDHLVSERWIVTTEPLEADTEGMAAEQVDHIERADAEGLGWRLEIYDPAANRTVRISDSEGSTAAAPPGQLHFAHGELSLDDPESLTRIVAHLLGYDE